jgi:hypothetical protein
MSVGIWTQNCNEQRTSKLAEERKAHANWTDFSREDLRNIEVHSGVTESTAAMLA